MEAADDWDAPSAQDVLRLKREHFALSAAPVPPASNTERCLLGIWEQVLDVDGLGVEDDFFELGGESLAAVTLFAEMEQVLGQMPPLSTLLEYPTIRRLAGRLDLLSVTAARPQAPMRSKSNRGMEGHASRQVARGISRLAGRVLALFARAIKGGAA